MSASKELVDRFKNNTEELLQKIRQYDEASFNRKRADGGWSPCEIAEHLLLFDIRLNEVLSTLDTASNRDPLEKVPAFTPRVTNREVKLTAPTFLEPSGKNDTPVNMAGKIMAERKKIIHAAETKDLAMMSSQYPHRIFGDMTGEEWITFVIMHTERHLPDLHK